MNICYEKLTTPEELSKIFNWPLVGLKRLQKQKEFTNRMTIEQTKLYYERLVSPVAVFIQDRIIKKE
jgi:phage/plasmid-associated DNA primase